MFYAIHSSYLISRGVFGIRDLFPMESNKVLMVAIEEKEEEKETRRGGDRGREGKKKQ